MSIPSGAIAAEQPSFLTVLRHAIAPVHERLEQSTVARELMTGVISATRYRRLVIDLWQVHHTIDPVLTADHALQERFGHPPARGPALAADAAALGSPVPPQATVLPAWEALVRDPPGRLGVQFAIEGSRNGSRMLAPLLARVLGVEVAMGRGLDYHLQFQDRAPQAWRQALASFGSHPPHDGPAMIAATVRAMELLLPLYENP